MRFPLLASWLLTMFAEQPGFLLSTADKQCLLQYFSTVPEHMLSPQLESLLTRLGDSATSSATSRSLQATRSAENQTQQREDCLATPGKTKVSREKSRFRPYMPPSPTAKKCKAKARGQCSRGGAAAPLPLSQWEKDDEPHLPRNPAATAYLTVLASSSLDDAEMSNLGAWANALKTFASSCLEPSSRNSSLGNVLQSCVAANHFCGISKLLQALKLLDLAFMVDR